MDKDKAEADDDPRNLATEPVDEPQDRETLEGRKSVDDIEAEAVYKAALEATEEQDPDETERDSEDEGPAADAAQEAAPATTAGDDDAEESQKGPVPYKRFQAVTQQRREAQERLDELERDNIRLQAEQNLTERLIQGGYICAWLDTRRLSRFDELSPSVRR